MALDFPNSPTNGQPFTGGGVTWIWDTVKWTPGAIATSTIAYVPLAGGTMTGALILNADPTVALGAATKQYVDSHTSPGGAVVSPTPPASPSQGALWWDDVGGQLYVWYTDINSSQWVDTNSGGGQTYQAGPGLHINTATAPPTIDVVTPYLPLAGGTLTGPLILAADPTIALGAVTKQYSDTKLPLAGGTLTGNLIISTNSYSTLALVSPMGNSNLIRGFKGANLLRWEIDLGETTAESGSNTGSNFSISRFNDAGTFIDYPITINRQNGQATFAQNAVISPATGWAALVITSSAGNRSQIMGYRGANARWELDLIDGATESGSNAGSNFGIVRYTDAGVAVDYPFYINRASGITTINNLTVPPGGSIVLPNNTWLDGNDSGGTPHQLIGVYTDNNMYLGNGLNTIVKGTLIVQTGGDTGSSASQAGFTSSHWRFRVAGGDDSAAGSIDYRGYDGGALGIVGAGTSTTNRWVRIFDNLNVSVNCQATNFYIGASGLLYFYDAANSTIGMSGSIKYSGFYLYMNNGAGTVNSSGGPFIYADSSSMVFHLGTGNAQFTFQNTGGATLALVSAAGAFSASQGYTCKSGSGGSTQPNVYNIDWSGGAHLWIDVTNQGLIAFQSDYRIKENIRPLGSKWDAVKALRPISYNLKDNEKLLSRYDPAERWGFLAHELQETLIERAATGYKDAENVVQSPDPWVMLAAVVSTLQEAMARIEQLEGAR